MAWIYLVDDEEHDDDYDYIASVIENDDNDIYICQSWHLREIIVDNCLSVNCLFVLYGESGTKVVSWQPRN